MQTARKHLLDAHYANAYVYFIASPEACKLLNNPHPPINLLSFFCKELYLLHAAMQLNVLLRFKFVFSFSLFYKLHVFCILEEISRGISRSTYIMLSAPNNRPHNASLILLENQRPRL